MLIQNLLIQSQNKRNHLSQDWQYMKIKRFNGPRFLKGKAIHQKSVGMGGKNAYPETRAILEEDARCFMRHQFPVRVCL
jgi:hypothetical protein